MISLWKISVTLSKIINDLELTLQILGISSGLWRMEKHQGKCLERSVAVEYKDKRT